MQIKDCNDPKRKCDRCNFFICSPCGWFEYCNFETTDKIYIENRLNGNKQSCKHYKKI